MVECCGNCDWYEYEGKDRKGSCGRIGCCYYPDDCCSHYKEGDTENVTEDHDGDLIYR